jgi:predicted nucleic acid-binding protein
MSGKEILVDTNILLYLLAGNDTLDGMLQGKHLYVSFLTELELLGYRSITSKEEKQVEKILGECEIVPLNNEIKKQYVLLRKKYPIKLVDAVIAATAIA